MEKPSKVHKSIVQLVQQFFFNRYTPQQLKAQTFSIFPANDSESYVGLLALAQFNGRQKDQFRVIISEHAYQALNPEFERLLNRLDISVSEGPYTCILYPYCQQHSSALVISSLFRSDGDDQLSECYPFTRLHFMANVSEQRIMQQTTELQHEYIGYSRGDLATSRVEAFLQESSRINYLALPNIEKATLLMEKLPHLKNSLKFPLTPLDSICEFFSMEHCQNEKFAVAFSGGKDSSALIVALSEYKCISSAESLEIQGVTFNPKLPGFDVDKIEQIYSELQQIVKRRFGYVLNSLKIINFDLARFIEDQDVGNACPVCARMRRGCISKFCLESDQVLALGHHTNDFAETALMTGIHSGGFFGLRQFYRGTSGENVARPLIYCEQKQVCDYLKEVGADRIEFVSSDAAECNLAAKIAKESERKRIREFIAQEPQLNIHPLATCFLRDCTKSEMPDELTGRKD